MSYDERDGHDLSEYGRLKQSASEWAAHSRELQSQIASMKRNSGLLELQVESLKVELKRRVDYRWSVPDEARLERMIKGALTHSLQEHGPIDRNGIWSAVKRVVGILREPFGEAKATIEGRDNHIAALEAEIQSVTHVGCEMRDRAHEIARQAQRERDDLQVSHAKLVEACEAIANYQHRDHLSYSPESGMRRIAKSAIDVAKEKS